MITDIREATHLPGGRCENCASASHDDMFFDVAEREDPPSAVPSWLCVTCAAAFIFASMGQWRSRLRSRLSVGQDVDPQDVAGLLDLVDVAEGTLGVLAELRTEFELAAALGRGIGDDLRAVVAGCAPDQEPEAGPRITRPGPRRRAPGRRFE